MSGIGSAMLGWKPVTTMVALCEDEAASAGKVILSRKKGNVQSDGYHLRPTDKKRRTATSKGWKY